MEIIEGIYGCFTTSIATKDFITPAIKFEKGVLQGDCLSPLLFFSERVAEWLRRLTRKPKVRTAVGSNPTLDSLVAVRYTSPGRPEPCEGILVAVAGSCGGVMVKHPGPCWK